MSRLLATSSSAAPLFLRLALGIVFCAHGAQKVFGWFGGPGWSGTIQHFEQGLGIAPPLTMLVMLTELLGGIALVVGLLTRLAAFGITVIMVVAVAMAHWPRFFMDWQNTGGADGQPVEGFEFHLLAVAIGLALMVTGGGAMSMDAALARRRQSMPRR